MSSNGSIADPTLLVSVIVALLVTEFPISMVAALGMTVLALTQSTTCTGQQETTISCCFETTLSGFADEVNWLVFAAFAIGQAVEKTQLGRRISLVLVRYLGGSMLGLGYAVFLSEVALGPFVPSNTARGGGILLPIVASIAKTVGSDPLVEPRRNGGEFLILCGAHANLVSASL